MGIIITKKTDNFAIVSKNILWDKRLSPKARFLLIFCLSLADNWEFSVKGLSCATGAGVTAIRTSLMELERIGYLKRAQSHSSDGRFDSADYVFYETPRDSVELDDKGNPDPDKDLAAENPTDEGANPPSDTPISENPISEERTQLNTNILNTNKIKYQGNYIYPDEHTQVHDTAEQPRKFAENVSMYEGEYQKLIDKLGTEEAAMECIEILDNYKGAHGAKYKSDYKAILSWVINSYYERKKKNSSFKECKNDVRRAAASVADMLDGGGLSGFFK